MAALKFDPKRVMLSAARMDQQPYGLDDVRRPIVLNAIQEVCRYRGWYLQAAHVRSTHVHVVLDADVSPEAVMGALKAYASRHLNEKGIDASGRKRWARHGSTRWIWKHQDVLAAVQYVIGEQGQPMSVFVSDVV